MTSKFANLTTPVVDQRSNGLLRSNYTPLSSRISEIGRNFEIITSDCCPTNQVIPMPSPPGMSGGDRPEDGSGGCIGRWIPLLPSRLPEIPLRHLHYVFSFQFYAVVHCIPFSLDHKWSLIDNACDERRLN